MNQHVIGAGIEAGTARTEARPFSDRSEVAAQVRRGVITAVSGSTYTVDVIGASGPVLTVSGVPAWGGASLSVDDRVLVIFEPTRPIPYIMAGGAGGGAASYMVTACLLTNGE